MNKAKIHNFSHFQVEGEFVHHSSTLVYKVKGVAQVENGPGDENGRAANQLEITIFHGIKNVTEYFKDLNEEVFFELEDKMQKILHDKANERISA